ncbi:hypothetical protein HU200_047617 [Digitaria exilis]|uniref:Uncharacterized protein n=1 Tax=Digitaria exilis TaxID=1010633 RepID=A0A835EA25_9POAL|nr:hypothetical protein HU200_047617 [Digitaria exilis]
MHENFILPKYCALIVLRFTHADTTQPSTFSHQPSTSEYFSLDSQRL